MPNIYDKDKPYPENKSDRPVRKRYSVWTIVGILIVLALLVWIFAFSYGEQEATAMELFTTSGIASEIGVLTG